MNDLTSSFLLDLQAAGPTELAVPSGAAARFAEEAGIDASVHETAAAALAQLARAGCHDA